VRSGLAGVGAHVPCPPEPHHPSALPTGPVNGECMCVCVCVCNKIKCECEPNKGVVEHQLVLQRGIQGGMGWGMVQEWALTRNFSSTACIQPVSSSPAHHWDPLSALSFVSFRSSTCALQIVYRFGTLVPWEVWSSSHFPGVLVIHTCISSSLSQCPAPLLHATHGPFCCISPPAQGSAFPPLSI
jgi:hypothetical protein